MRAGVLTVSDGVAEGVREDASGEAAEEILRGLGFEVERKVVPDGVEPVQEAIIGWLEVDFELVVTTGGTGFGPRDLTPEATRPLLDRPAPGIAEAMRAVTFGVNPHGMLSRGVAGIAGRTVIFNLPGSPQGVRESLEVVAPALGHAVRLVRDLPTEH